jgi:hypothetical protein
MPLLAGSSNLPGGFGRAALKRLPIWSCSVRGFACHFCCQKRGALLPHHFTLTHRSAEGAKVGGIFSVPLFRQVTLPGRYPAHCPLEFGLSSPDRATTPAVARRLGLDRQRSSGLAAAPLFLLRCGDAPLPKAGTGLVMTLAEACPLTIRMAARRQLLKAAFG